MTNAPTINLIQKSQLARLLATENILVEHSHTAQSASFDTNKRCLVLPIWEKASVNVYDMLVAHEVGHALVTPTYEVFWPICQETLPSNPKKFFRYLNIVEDVRVDAHVKDTYPGIRRSYFEAFKELMSRDFFQLKKEPDLKGLLFGDRLNIHTKAGQYGLIEVPFSDEEMVVVQEALKVRTFDDVVAVAKKVYALDAQGNKSNEQWDVPQAQSKKKKKKSPPMDGGTPKSGGKGGGSPESGSAPVDPQDDASESPSDDGDDSEDSSEEGSDGEQNEQGEGGEQNDSQDSSDDSDDASDDSFEDFEKELKSDKSLDDRLADLTGTAKSGINYKYYDLPEIDLDSVVFDYKTVLKDLSLLRTHTNFSGDKIFAKIKERNGSYVLNLVKQFEQKMAADSIRRTSYAKSGRLDMRRISNYKFSDDLFMKNVTTTNGKNHGMVFVMDWSGSMSEYLLPTVEQLITLCLFCRRMNIPFEVFAFTNNMVGDSVSKNFITKIETRNDGYGDYKVRDIQYGNFLRVDDIGMMNFLSSSMNKSDFQTAAENLCQLAMNEDYSTSDLRKIGCRAITCSYDKYPPTLTKDQITRLENYRLSSTPLTESVVVSIQLVNRFKIANRLEIVNTIFLTDGEPTSSVIADKYCTNSILNLPDRSQRVLYDASCYDTFNQTDNRYRLGCGQAEFFNMIEVFRAMTGSNAIYIHLIPGRFGERYVRGYSNSADVDKNIKDWKTNDFFSVKGFGFNEMFFIDCKTETSDIEDIFDGLKQDASDAVIARTFIKGNMKQASSRVLLSRFSDVIAKKIIGK